MAAGVVKIDSEIDPIITSTCTCAGATIAHAFDVSAPQSRSIILIIGSGPLGIFTVSFAKKQKAKEIVVIGGNEKRLEFCKKIGANHVINRNYVDKEERKKIIQDLTDGRGVDWVIETVSNIEALRESISLLRVGGTCISVGFGLSNETFSFDPSQELVRKGLKIQGVWMSNGKHLKSALNVLKENYNDFQEFVTHRFSLFDATNAIVSLNQKDLIKAVLLP